MWNNGLCSCSGYLFVCYAEYLLVTIFFIYSLTFVLLAYSGLRISYLGTPRYTRMTTSSPRSCLSGTAVALHFSALVVIFHLFWFSKCVC